MDLSRRTFIKGLVAASAVVAGLPSLGGADAAGRVMDAFYVTKLPAGPVSVSCAIKFEGGTWKRVVHRFTLDQPTDWRFSLRRMAEFANGNYGVLPQSESVSVAEMGGVVWGDVHGYPTTVCDLGDVCFGLDMPQIEWRDTPPYIETRSKAAFSPPRTETALHNLLPWSDGSRFHVG